MKLKKLIKLSYDAFLDYEFDDCETTKDVYSVAFQDGILHTFLTMREMGVNIAVIKQVMDQIDPKGESFAAQLISEEYEYYLKTLELFED